LRPDALLAVSPTLPTKWRAQSLLATRMEALAHDSAFRWRRPSRPPEGDLRRLQQKMRMPVFTEIEEAIQGLAASREWPPDGAP